MTTANNDKGAAGPMNGRTMNRPVKIARDDMLLMLSRAYDRLGGLMALESQARDIQPSDSARTYCDGKIMAYREARNEIAGIFDAVKEAQ